MQDWLLESSFVIISIGVNFRAKEFQLIEEMQLMQNMVKSDTFITDAGFLRDELRKMEMHPTLLFVCISLNLAFAS